MNNLFQVIKNMFKYEKPMVYDFTIPEAPNEQMYKNISYDEELQAQKSKNEPKNILPSLSANLDYIKKAYLTDINSDIITREFTLIAKNKQYNAFLIYIDGMVNTELINSFILNPLMLRNRANIYDNNDGMIVKESISNNISVRRVKKFNLLDYIFTSLMPQNSVKTVKEFKEIISRCKLAVIVVCLLILWIVLLILMLKALKNVELINLIMK